jgi:hypothetical protein
LWMFLISMLMILLLVFMRVGSRGEGQPWL